MSRKRGNETIPSPSSTKKAAKEGTFHKTKSVYQDTALNILLICRTFSFFGVFFSRVNLLFFSVLLDQSFVARNPSADFRSAPRCCARRTRSPAKLLCSWFFEASLHWYWKSSQVTFRPFSASPPLLFVTCEHRLVSKRWNHLFDTWYVKAVDAAVLPLINSISELHELQWCFHMLNAVHAKHRLVEYASM